MAAPTRASQSESYSSGAGVMGAAFCAATQQSPSTAAVAVAAAPTTARRGCTAGAASSHGAAAAATAAGCCWLGAACSCWGASGPCCSASASDPTPAPCCAGSLSGKLRPRRRRLPSVALPAPLLLGCAIASPPAAAALPWERFRCRCCCGRPPPPLLPPTPALLGRSASWAARPRACSTVLFSVWLKRKSFFHPGLWHTGHSLLMMPGPSKVAVTQSLHRQNRGWRRGEGVQLAGAAAVAVAVAAEEQAQAACAVLTSRRCGRRCQSCGACQRPGRCTNQQRDAKGVGARWASGRCAACKQAAPAPDRRGAPRSAPHQERARQLGRHALPAAPTHHSPQARAAFRAPTASILGFAPPDSSVARAALCSTQHWAASCWRKGGAPKM